MMNQTRKRNRVINRMTKTRGQQNQATARKERINDLTDASTSTLTVPALPLAQPVLNAESASPPDILSIISDDTASISEKSKVLINQKDQTIEKMQNHITQLEDRIVKLENELEEVNLYERRDTLIISGPNLPNEVQNENCGESN
ncbi:hypothetical protein E2C01_029064 [Portunus trituberculatus]|uniref:Uncharacterized protein n=1 Tax=Portunus trituberculatus TaxID=210409 RepID=A0A5B7EQT7_PORTR|nr:hypothetical protein [Portunus trituberculatus]